MAIKPLHIFACCCCLALCIAIGIIIGVSFDTLEATEIGIDYNPNSKNIDENQIQTAGRQFLGPGHSFYKFSNAIQTESLTISSRTKDGLQITIDITYNQRLKTDLKSVIQLMQTMGNTKQKLQTDQKKFQQQFAKNKIRDSLAEFKAYDLFDKRSEVSNQMQNDLAKRLDEVFATLQSFQLNSYSLPPSFENVILETQNKDREIRTYTELEEVVKTTAAGNISKAKAQVTAIINKAQEVANSISNDAEAKIINIKQTTEALSNSLMATNEILLFEKDSQKIAQYYLQILEKIGGKKFINFPSTTTMKCINTNDGKCNG